MPLPVFEISDALQSALQSERSRILLKAPTGSGKSTSVPGMVADGGIQGMIVVIEPRRMAARMLAHWVAQQRQTSLGDGVGYAVRFDANYREHTKIVYLTDGVFQRWLQENPELPGVGAVIFDEFHERRLSVDIALSRCLNLQEGTRPDLKVIVMSATLETAGLADFLAPAVTLEAGGRLFPVDIVYRPDTSAPNDRRGGPPRETPIWEKMVHVCKEALQSPDPGHILMFLPGTHEIRKTIELLENQSCTRGWQILPLYSTLPPHAQDAAVAPSKTPKIIVATNVAETSLTIDGVKTVIDSGLARISAFEPRRGINTLWIKKISRAAADQRAGRAGRTAPGRTYRLWSQADHGRREEFDQPEVHRVDLAESILLLLDTGISNVREFRWFEPPTEAAVSRAENLLHDLGALDEQLQLTDDGRHMAGLPLEPRFAKLLLSGLRYDCLAETAFIAAAVQAEPIFSARKSNISRKDFLIDSDGTDFAGEWRAFETALAHQLDPARCASLGLVARAAREISLGLKRLEALAHRNQWPWRAMDFEKNRGAIGHAMLASFSDQLAIRFNAGTLACRLIHNRRGKLDEESCVKNAPAFVAAEITEVEAREVIVHLRRATAIDPEWIETQFPDEIHHTDAAAWDDSRRRVVRRQATVFRDLTLDTKESDHNVNLDQAAEILAARVLLGELTLKNWDHSVEQWASRLNLLHRAMPELELPSWTDDDKAAAIAQICHGSVAYKDIKEAKVWPTLKDWLSAPQRAALDAYAPERITLPNGQSAKICYDPDRDPHISVRVSHLFGTWETPCIANGRIPLLVHILTPGQKPWQMTKDLRSFWATGYAQMKKEVAGRYPRHPWPDDPKSWTPPPRTKPNT